MTLSGFPFVQTSTWSPQGTDPGPQTSQPCWGLPYLFSAQDCKPSAQEPADPATGSPSSSSWCHVVDDKVSKPPQWTCVLSLDLSVLSEEVLATLQAKGDYRGAWFRRVRTLFLWVLRDVFLFTVKVDKDGGALVDEDLDREEEEEAMCLDSSGGGGGGGGGCESAESNTSDGGSGVDDDKAGTAGGVDGEEGGGAQVVASTEDHPPEGLASGSNATQSGAVSPEDGMMQSPQSQHSCSLYSPGEGPLSPMAVSEPTPLSPGACEARKTSPHSHISSARQPAAIASDSPQHDSPVTCEPPCSPLTVSQNSPSKPISHGCGMSGFQPGMGSAAVSCDVEMAMDPNTEAVHPARSQMDLPVDSQALPHRCAMGEAASRTSPAPLRVECSPVGDGKVCARTKDSPLGSCDLEAAAVMEAGPSLQPAMLRLESDVPAVQVNPTPVPAQDPTTSSGNTSASACTAQRPYKKCRALRVYCEGKCKAWYGRKVMRSILMDEGHTDLLELEKLISQRIAARDSGSSLTPLAFHCTLSPVPKATGAEAEIWFQPEKPVPKEFSVFTTFFKSFFAKLVPKNLVESATV